MKKKYLLLIVLTTVLVALLATACPNNSTNISPPTPFFPAQRGGLSQMDALLEGRLELDNGYLRVKYFDDNYLLIWPHGFSLRTEGEEIQVINRDGQVVARVGDRIKVGGGEVPAETAEEYIGQPLPDNCPGPYWIVSEVVTVLTYSTMNKSQVDAKQTALGGRKESRYHHEKQQCLGWE